MSVSARLAMWASAAVGGQVSFDDALDAVSAGSRHMVIGLDRPAGAEHEAPWADGSVRRAQRFEPSTGVPAQLAAPFIHWRKAQAPVRLTLPVPGDVRGAPTARAFLAAALDAGQGVFAAGLGLVPTTPTDGVGVHWTAFAVDEPAPDALQLSEAEHELARAMRETATLLGEAQVGGMRGVDAAELARIRRVGDDFRFAPGFAGRAAALVTQAERLEAMLELALRDSIGAAVDRIGISVRAQALTRLRDVVRRARLAGYNNGYLAARNG